MDTPVKRILVRDINHNSLRMYDPASPEYFLNRPTHFQQYEGLYYKENEYYGYFHNTYINKWIVIYNHTSSNDAWKNTYDDAQKYANAWNFIYDKVSQYFSKYPEGNFLESDHTDRINDMVKRFEKGSYIFRQKNTLFVATLDDEKLPTEIYVLKYLKLRLVLVSLDGGPSII